MPAEETEDVKNHVVKKLKRCWPGLDAESQIIYMSTMRASKAQDVSSLMNSMRSMVLKSVDAGMEIHWK